MTNRNTFETLLAVFGITLSTVVVASPARLDIAAFGGRPGDLHLTRKLVKTRNGGLDPAL